MAPIVRPFMPALLHLATVKIALPLYKDFEIGTLCAAFGEILNENSPTYNKCSQRNREERFERAKEKLRIIPGHLRRGVMEAVKGFHYAAEIWQEEHETILKLKDLKNTLYWKLNGSIDAVKTAQHLVQNKEIKIEKRFQMACKYCFEKSIQTLWAEMEASCKTDNFETDDNPMVSHWIRWVCGGSQAPWTKMVIENFDPSDEYPPKRFIRFSPFFHKLQPKDRQMFLLSLEFSVTDKDDFLACMYTVDKDEEMEVLKAFAQSVLCYSLEWPMQSAFILTAKKMIERFIDESLFCLLLNHIFLLKDNREDFCYSEIFDDFWNMSPDRFKKAAENDPNLREAIQWWKKL